MDDSTHDWRQALANFDRTPHEQDFRQAEAERQQVVQRFPLSEWPDLPLERYALGLGAKENSYCWWLEFGSPNVGSMKGGAAHKHLIYRRKDGTWYFDKTYPNEAAAWLAVRSAFVEAFNKASQGDWDGVVSIDVIAGAAALRSKSLYTYFPTELLPITSVEHLRHFLRATGSSEQSLKGLDVVELNRLLLQRLRAEPASHGFTNKELERFLYEWDDPREQRQVLKIAPGENAILWPECLERNYIRVGWGKVGNLSEFGSLDDLKTKLREVYGEFHKHHEPTISGKAKELWLLRELEPGDVIFANQGTSKILAVGTVVEPGYEWIAQENDDYNHVVHVKWKPQSEKENIPPQKRWAFMTVAPVSQALAAQVLDGGKTGNGNGPSPPVDPLFRELERALERKGQVILFGPPGTGKTYSARRFAVWWAMKRAGDRGADQILGNQELLDQAEQRLSTAQVSRRAWWIVANPKEWSWSRLFKDKTVDYRYGKLARNYPLVRKGDLAIGYQSTPDKKVMALARVQRELHVDDDGEQRITLAPVARVEDGLTYDELKSDPVLGESEPMRFNNQGTLFAITEDEFDHLSALLSERNPELRSHLASSAHTIGAVTRLTFHASYSYEDFIEGFRPVDTGTGSLVLRLEDGIFKRICREAQTNPKRTYVVLIDEFNRANVAKVLGELITLLEKDKRGLLIALPQSKQAFTIPPNVFIIATMNTADRSIKLLDAALRRRFSFIELMPNSELLKGKVGNLAVDKFLDELNRRVARREGREKQIGHSFLMDGDGPVTEPEEFARRFRQEILPLLQEYCYDDYRVLAEYVGEKLVDHEAHRLNSDVLDDADALLEALEDALATDGASA